MDLNERIRVGAFFLFSTFMINFIPNFNEGIDNVFSCYDYTNSAENVGFLKKTLDEKESFRQKGIESFRTYLGLKEREEKFLEKADYHEKQIKKYLSRALIYGKY